jgi:hypothetical protein
VGRELKEERNSMRQSRYAEYIERFNARDATAFEEFVDPEARVLNGTLTIRGLEAMKHHYQALIWPDFDEKLYISRFVSNDRHLAIQMRTEFRALHDKKDTLFGPTVAGDAFEFNGLILYDLTPEERFSQITVAYNRFEKIGADGMRVDLGIPH